MLHGRSKIVLGDFKQFGAVSVAFRGVPKVSGRFRTALRVFIEFQDYFRHFLEGLMALQGRSRALQGC